MANRPQTLQCFLDFYEDPSYLEVGVQHGITFHQIRAKRKVAVDPNFLFPAEERQADAEYFELPSDEYFATLNRDSPKFDVIFLDGLHTFEQTLRDLLAAIDHLAPDGVIVVDDVIPSSYHASLPSIPEFEQVWQVANHDGSVGWMGDVYRLVYFVEGFIPAFAYATTIDNHGQLVMWRGKRGPELNRLRTVEAVSRLEYKDTVISGAEFNKLPLAEIVSLARRDVSP